MSSLNKLFLHISSIIWIESLYRAAVNGLTMKAEYHLAIALREN